MAKSNNIILSNFLKMTPEAPEYSPKNPHYLIAGANPTYYTDVPGTQEEQIAPLIASLNWNEITSSLDGNIIGMCSASIFSGDNAAIVLMTSTSQVWAVTSSAGVPTGVVSLGYPSGSALSGLTHADLCCANGLLYVAYGTASTNIWSLANFVTPVWTSRSISDVTFGANSFLLPFLDYVMINSTNTIMKFDGSFASNVGITLGTGWQIYGVENYNDKYMAIAAARTSGVDYTENYLFLWDGISDTYNYAMRIPGAYLDMKVINSVLYVVLSLTRNRTAVYQMNNNFLVPYFQPTYLNADQFGVGPGSVPVDIHCLFNYQANVGLRLETNGTFTCPLMIYENTPAGVGQFILTSGNKFSRIIEGTDGTLYASNYVSGGDDTLYYYPSTNTSWQTIQYQSQWIPVDDNISGIDIIYDSPPQTDPDAINVTIYGRGEDILTGTSTTVLPAITPENFLNQRRTRLDLQGFVGDKIMILLTTVNSGTWRPIIRGVNLIRT